MWEELVRAGLDPKEARLYLAVLEAQRCTVAEAATLADVTRTNAYDIARKLVNRGLLSLTEVGASGKAGARGRAVLTANDPGHLLDEWTYRKNLLDDLVPRLRALRGDGQHQPRVRFMAGEAGIRAALFETLSWPSPLRGILSMKDLLTVPGSSAMREYIEGRRERNLFLRVVRSPERDYPSGWPTDAEDLRETRYAPESHIFTMTMIVGPHAVAVLSSRRENFAMMIESAEYAETQAHLFEVLWQVSQVETR
ncbi:transcriptional regulator [Aeromicrobium phragmitis]|uniref:Transcriptional regulator n=1 Tax=Aeromicrobium phragmitis TaxID=2478914 RepID=A0A3L8PJU4_9ACTN|nr:helix-turn-helix domain-containing protein [Aeromicrobium phragmitis]RLV54858.1 transcriptional regulator [Aeromicrobium phragmitis]